METLLSHVCKGNLSFISKWMDHLEDINSVLTTEEEVNLTFLHVVVDIDSIFRDDVIKLILARPEVDVNKHSGPGNDCRTAAHIAAGNGYATTLLILLRHGADPYLFNIHCNTVWEVAAINNQKQCLKILESEENHEKTISGGSEGNDTEESIYYSLSNLSFDEPPNGVSGTDSRSSEQESVIFLGTQPREDWKIRKVEKRSPPKKGAIALQDNSLTPKPVTGKKKELEPTVVISKDRFNETEYYVDRDFNVSLVSSVASARTSPDSTLVNVSIGDETILGPIDPSLLQLTNAEVRQQLQRYGESPGPINETTRTVYLRRLGAIKKGTLINQSPIKTPVKLSVAASPRSPVRSPIRSPINSPARLLMNHPFPGYPPNINLVLLGRFNFETARELENEFLKIFAEPKGPIDFFNYLLLDPRKTQNLSRKAAENHYNFHGGDQQNSTKENNLFIKFIEAIFYIGKGKNNRPYMHLYEACLKPKAGKSISAKVKRITQIWDSGYGVISHHVFLGRMTSNEAYARESLMIDAIGINNLTNIRLGQNKLIPSAWTLERRRALGTLLLYKAYRGFALNDERQIRRYDISDK